MFSNLIVFVSLVIVLYFYLKSRYNFWTLRNVTGPAPNLIFGTITDLITSRESVATYCKKIYEEYPDQPFTGLYVLQKPVLMLNDVNLIKTILIKDFNSFPSRGVHIDERNDPLSANLFSLEAKRWRPLRTKLTPMFTSGRLRKMFSLFKDCSDQLERYLEDVQGRSIDIREITAKFATDVIGVCAFGIEMNALKDEDSVFREMGRRVLRPSWRLSVRTKLRQFSPFLHKVLGRWLKDSVLNDFFVNLTRETFRHREQSGVTRHDFISLLKELKEESAQFDGVELTDSIMAAQLFVFFVAGFETSSSTMSSCLLELALNHRIQDKVRKEIQEELEKTGGDATYEGINNMKYLDKVVKETLRKYPPVPVLLRESASSYTFPGTEVSVPGGTGIWIPLFAIQRDPRHFPDPEVFDPERFDDQCGRRRGQVAWLAFGDGPRNCIATRFGMMQAKLGIVTVLRNFTVDKCEKTDENYEINHQSFLLVPKNGVFVSIARPPTSEK